MFTLKPSWFPKHSETPYGIVLTLKPLPLDFSAFSFALTNRDYKIIIFLTFYN